MVIYNPYPGTLMSRSDTTAIYESVCITQFDEAELKNIVSVPFLIIPSNNDMEFVKFLGAMVRFSNSGVLLTDGSDLIIMQGTVFNSGALPATMFLTAESLAQVSTTSPAETPYGIPLTMISNAEYPYEEGSGDAMISVVSMYRRTVKL